MIAEVHLASKLVYTALLLLVAPVTYGFGADAHLVIGYIAERHLCADAEQEVAHLLNGESLAEAGLWADEIRSESRWDFVKPLHYINVPDGAVLSDVKRSRRGDVLTAIGKYRLQIADDSLTLVQRRQALRLLTHFVADVHQPLHVGRFEDLGGNKVDVIAAGKKMDLHYYWDTFIVRGRVDSAYAYAAQLDAQNYRFVERWQESEPESWAVESMALRREVYDFVEPADGSLPLLEGNYQLQAQEIIDFRMSQAGVRLAAALNKAWCGVE